MTAEPLPDWFMPPPGGWTADDMDDLPPGVPRMELIDGALIVTPPQTRFHARVMGNLSHALREVSPPGVTADLEITVKLGKRQRPEPDVLVYREPEDPHEADNRTCCSPDEVLLVVEIVSEESEDRDRVTKPDKYALAGIPHFWRIERERGEPVVHVYELDGIKEPRYIPVTIARERLKLDVPFPVDIDVKALAR
ncbi:Uma2 family endonuclease [Nocardiopsis sinuspersici]|nr:Uma2 family endonuclease [Nocardiopsis sinuspersici]